MRRTAVFLATCLLATQGLAADKVQAPVAVRWWGQGMVSIETYWNLTVVIDPYGEGIGYTVPELSADLVLVTHEHADHNDVEAVKGEPTVVRALDGAGNVRKINHYFDRFENSDDTEWWSNTKANSARQTDHSVFVRSIPAWHDDSQGSERGSTAMFQIVVDGVTILHCGDLGQSTLTEEQLTYLKHVDVMLLPAGGVYTIDGEQAWDIIEQVKPRIVIPIHYKTDKLKIPLEQVDKFVTRIPANWKLKKSEHNTLAVSAVRDSRDENTSPLVVLDYEPWQPTGELATLLDKMDTACKESQQVFAKLSTEQMNWRPPNGTHTPRWNAEHMMGRQLGFFTQIYAAIEPETFTHIDLNPKQMPDDYQAAHPDWDGAEEARQMQRASAYVRRFAYLLEGLDLDAKAPGSFWTPRRLLKQMDRHFGEHTANVVKKMELESWPAE